MAIFKTEKELNDFMETGIAGLIKRFDMPDPEIEIERGIDFCRTLMAEYSRLLYEGKITRPLAYSASIEKGQDESVKLLSDLLYGQKVDKGDKPT